ncbi:MAG: type VII secretion protein EssC, partial [Promicromonosporaceae bacterium]|nr:type VII secretion protein EssC [Promicromonosporaceae bacterium]
MGAPATLVVFTEAIAFEFSGMAGVGEIIGTLAANGVMLAVEALGDVDLPLANTLTGVPGEPIEIAAGVWALLLDGVEVTFSTRAVVADGLVRVGMAAGDHLRLTGIEQDGTVVSWQANTLQVWLADVSVYLDGKRLPVGEYRVEAGDCLWINREFRVTVGGGFIRVAGSGYVSELNRATQAPERPVEYPVFKRPPRQVYREPVEKVNIAAPPMPPDTGWSGLGKLLVAPLLTASATAALGVFMGQGIMMLMGAAMTVISIISSAFGFVTQRRERKLVGAQEQADYDAYLRDKRRELGDLKRAQVKAGAYHYLNPAKIAEEMAGFSSRVFERANTDGDFLTVSIGTAPAPVSYTVQPLQESKEENKSGRRGKTKTSVEGGVPALVDQVKDVLAEHQVVEEMPVVVDLKAAHLGLVGDAAHVHRLISGLLLDLCFFQSYHDIEVIVLTNEEGRAGLKWAKWLPHCRVKSINVTGLISGENHRDQALGNLAQVLKQRSLTSAESKQDSRYLPHYVFVVDNPSLVVNHSIMEFLQVSDTTLGFSLIWASSMQANLPENIKTVVTLDGPERGTLLMNEGQLDNRLLALPSVTGVDVELAARRLAPIKHMQGVSTQIPEAVTFFSLYGVKRPEEIPILDLWHQAAPHKTLAVPLGLRGKDDVVMLNLHEGAHGPHGLVAGTTGSGKSEIVQSYILSLAAHFHPYEVGFLLIDYKGGGMANLFENLPHLMGTITNLDGAGSMRALASIKSELARRQRVFGDAGVNNINAYTKKIHAGETGLEPLPHLFIISDEFAELKKEQPEFMAELVSTARIGRSLGVHLILATQKPSGVVDDQIWSNSKFKLALKVANESDSNEVLKTPDAARITQPGRAYLQVGNNEIYELFQSAWSGAPYVADAVERGFDARVYTINELGQGVLVNDDISAADASTDVTHTQLDVMVGHIQAVYGSLGNRDVPKPWLPPLGEQLVTPAIPSSQDTHPTGTENQELVDVGDVGLIDELNLVVPLGLVDIPEQQAQVEFEHDFAAAGNLAVYGASGTGKSVTLSTLALSLAARNSPGLCQFHILDYGNSGLAALRNLPHTANYLAIDDGERLGKLIQALAGELKTRKGLFAEHGATNFTMYNQAAQAAGRDRLPAIIVFIDNYDVVPEASEALEEFLTKLTRDGVGVGVFVVASATRPGAI